jgi:ribonuclease P protein component
LPGTPKPDERLPRALVLREREAFDRIRGQGQRVHGRFCTLTFLAGDQEAGLAAFVAGKRCGNAVQRNSLRRRMREIHRKLRHTLPANASLIWSGKPEGAETASEALEKEMRELASRAGLCPTET